MTKELRGIPAKKVVAAFQKAGFRFLRQKGSHVLMYKAGFPLLVVPVHSEPVKVGLLRKEIKKAGMTVEQFQDLL